MSQVEIDRGKMERGLSASKEKGWTEVNILHHTEGAWEKELPAVITPILEDVGDLLITWHFLHEDGCWKGEESPGCTVTRVRFRAKLPYRKTVGCVIWNELACAMKDGIIIDYYFGCHGIQGKTYYGEADDFNEKSENPIGWKVFQEWLHVGSKMALLMLKVRTKTVKPGEQTHFRRALHFVANQMGRVEWTPNKGDWASSFFVVGQED